MHSSSGSSRPAPPDRQEVLAHIGLGALVADVARMLPRQQARPVTASQCHCALAGDEGVRRMGA
jgi:hypothetical protein